MDVPPISYLLLSLPAPLFIAPFTVLKPELLLSGLTTIFCGTVYSALDLVACRFYKSLCGATYPFALFKALRTFSSLSNASFSLTIRTEVRKPDGNSGVETRLQTFPASPTSSKANASNILTIHTLQTKTDKRPCAMEKKKRRVSLQYFF